MTRELRRLLLWDARRCWRIWAAAAALAFVLLWVPMAHRAPLSDIGSINAILIPVLLANATSWQRSRGWFDARLLLPLPLSALGQAQWWLAIGWPGLVLSGSVLAVWVGEAALGSGPRSVWPWLLGVWSMLGFQIALELVSRRLRIAGIAVILSIGGIVTLAYVYAPAAAFAVFLVAIGSIGLPAALWLHYRRDGLILWSLTQAPSWSIRMAVDLWPAAPGGPQRLARFGARMLAWLGTGIAAGAALTSAVAEAPVRDALLVALLGTAVPLLAARDILWRSAVRVLRALPLTADRIAATMLAMAAAPSLSLVLGVVAACRALAAPAAAFPASILVLPLLILLSSAQLLLVPVALRFGPAGATAAASLLAVVAVPVSVLATIGSILGEAPPLGGASALGGALALFALLAAASFAWTRHELRAGSHAYRPRFAATFLGMPLLPNEFSPR